VKIYFLNNWGDSIEKQYSRYIAQTPESDGKWGDIETTTDINQADYFIITEGRTRRNTSSLPYLKYPKHKKIYLQRDPSKPYFDGNDDAVFSGTYDKHYHVATWQIKKSFRELEALAIPQKNKKLSSIISNIQRDKFYKSRFLLASNLKKYIDDYDMYGKGTNPLNYNGFCKYRGLIDYRYSFCAENKSIPNYFTEKIIDCFLCWTKPIYWGCPNIGDYFPQESYTWVDIFSKDAAEKIKKEIQKPVNYDALRDARNLVLNKYNIYPSVSNIIKGL
jgi:hypothetical protein